MVLLTRSLRGSSALSLLKYFWSFILMWRGRRGLEKERKTHKWKCYHHQHHCVQKCGPQEWVPIKSGVRGREWGGHQEGTKSCFSSPSFIPPFDSFHNFFFFFLSLLLPMCLSVQCRFQKKWQNNTKTEKTFLIEKADFSWWWKCRFFLYITLIFMSWHNPSNQCACLMCLQLNWEK